MIETLTLADFGHLKAAPLFNCGWGRVMQFVRFEFEDAWVYDVRLIHVRHRAISMKGGYTTSLSIRT